MAHRIIPLINAARTNPDKTGDSLYQNLKSTFQDNQMKAFGKRIETFEGVKALNDLHQYLRNLAPTSNLLESPVLNRAAEQIAKQKGLKGDVTQQKPRVINQKISKTGKIVGKVGELICASTQTAEESAAYFLIDDGLVSRKRRRMLLDPSYKYVGAGQAKHSQYGSILVLLLAENISE